MIWQQKKKKIIGTLLKYNELTYREFKRLLQSFIDRYLVNNQAAENSMSMQSEMEIDESPIDEYEFTSNVIEPNLRRLAVTTVEMMFSGLKLSGNMAKSAIELKKKKWAKKSLEIVWKSHIFNYQHQLSIVYLRCCLTKLKK